jgi:hypothetical protein
MAMYLLGTFDCHRGPVLSPEMTSKMPEKARDSNNPMASTVFPGFEIVRGICTRKNQASIINPERKAAYCRIEGTKNPIPPASRQMPEK